MNTAHLVALQPVAQAKPPVPPLWLNELWALVGQAFSLPDFCHKLLGVRAVELGRGDLATALWYWFARSPLGNRKPRGEKANWNGA